MEFREEWKELVIELAASFLLTISIILLWRDNALLFAATLLIALAALGIWHDWCDLCFFLVAGVPGSLAEAVFVHFGVWRYANPTFMGIPVWFPISFGTAALIAERLARTILRMREKM